MTINCKGCGEYLGTVRKDAIYALWCPPCATWTANRPKGARPPDWRNRTQTRGQDSTTGPP